jgi:hypothetical protein
MRPPMRPAALVGQTATAALRATPQPARRASRSTPPPSRLAALAAAVSSAPGGGGWQQHPHQRGKRYYDRGHARPLSDRNRRRRRLRGKGTVRVRLFLLCGRSGRHSHIEPDLQRCHRQHHACDHAERVQHGHWRGRRQLYWWRWRGSDGLHRTDRGKRRQCDCNRQRWCGRQHLCFGRCRHCYLFCDFDAEQGHCARYCHNRGRRACHGQRNCNRRHRLRRFDRGYPWRRRRHHRIGLSPGTGRQHGNDVGREWCPARTARLRFRAAIPMRTRAVSRSA